MAYIVEFTVEGLAARDITIHRKLDRHLNIFWGLNGSGKTSLLKILDAALRNDSEMLERVPFRTASVTFYAESLNVLVRRSIDKLRPSASHYEEHDFEVPSLLPAGDGPWEEFLPLESEDGWVTEVLGDSEVPRRFLSSRFHHAYLPISRLTDLGRGRAPSERQRSVNDAALDEQFAAQVRQRWQIYNSDALSEIRAIQQSGIASILALLFGGNPRVAELGDQTIPGEVAYSMVDAFLSEQKLNLRLTKKDFLRRYSDESDLRLVVANIQEVMRLVDDAQRPQQELQSIIRSLYSGGKELVFGPSTLAGIGVQSGATEIPLQSLSAGEKQLLRLMLEVLAARSSTVMIDEPELSMHVDWQLDLVKSMQRVNPDCQLLLATHSPDVMAKVPSEVVFKL